MTIAEVSRQFDITPDTLRFNHKIENYGNCLAKEPELRGKAKD